MNRAERRRRGLTRSRISRTGSLASAGVLMSVGLFGAYTGSPRIQRAYATTAPASCGANPSVYSVTVDDSLIAALNNPTVTCIEIQGIVELQKDLPVLTDDSWVPYRQSNGLTIFGTGDDTLDGQGTWQGINVTIDDTPVPSITDDVRLSFSDLTLSEVGGSGGALYAYLEYQSQDLLIDFDGVQVLGNTSAGYGGAVYAASFSGGVSSVYVNVTDSTFSGNSGVGSGGAIFVSTQDDSAIVNVSTSTFSDNHVSKDTPNPNDYAFGGAISVRAWDPMGFGFALAKVGPNSTFAGNTVTAPDKAHGGAIWSGEYVQINGTPSQPVRFTDDSASGFGGGFYARIGTEVTGAIFEGNTAQVGGAIYNFDGPLSVTDTTIRNNTALDNAGGIYSCCETALVERSAVVNNTAYGSSGGGIYVFFGPLVIENSFIGGNSADTRGGGIFMKDFLGDVDLRFSTVYDDTTSSGQSTEIWARSITSTASVVGSSSTGNIWEFTGNLDDSYSVSTSDDTVFAGDGSENFAPGDLEFDAPDGAAPGQWGRTPSATSPLTTPEPNGLAPLFNPLPGITADQLGVTRVAPFTIGARQFVPPSPPTPPAPAPSVPASAPREVRAEAGVESAKASWLPPASTGSFPVTSYQAVASPGGHACLVAAPALTCTITGLTPGSPYTVTARALTGAGWSEASAPSSVVVPLGPEVPTILITNARDRTQKAMARIEGTTTGLVGAEVVPYLRMAGQTDFKPGASTRTVDAEGDFVWQRKAKKRFTVYFVSGDVTSNRLVIRPE